MPLLVEAGWGGVVTLPDTITWTDITQYVDVNQGVTITRGASDELSETQPGTATLTLDNADGRFTPGNPASPYHPFVRRNAPIRVSVAVMPATPAGAAPWPLAQLGDDFDDGVPAPVWTVAGGATETGGRLRLPVVAAGTTARYTSTRQWKLQGSSTTVKLCTVPAAGGSAFASVTMYVQAVAATTWLRWTYNAIDGKLRAYNDAGSTDATPTVLTYSPIDHAWLRIRESAGTVFFETSGDGYDWTVRRSLATPAWVVSDQVRVEVAANRSGGVSDYAEFDLLGADVRPRFYGLVNEFPVSWQGLHSTVQISCTDLFKRINKQPALRSMLGQDILDLQPLVYFPLTEDEAATSAGDVSGTGAPSLAITQAGAVGSGTLVLGSTEGPTETGEQVAAFTPASATSGKYLTADLGWTVDERMYDFLHLEAWFQTTTTGRCILGIHTPDPSDQHLLSIAPSGGLQIEWMTGGGALTTEAISGPTNLANGQWHHVLYDQYNVTIWIDGVLVDTSLAVSRAWAQRVLHVGGYRGTRLWNGAIGHVAIYATLPPVTDTIAPAVSTHYATGMTGHAGESADARIERLARYAGVYSVTVWGDTHDAMASQGPAGSTAMARMREVESTEAGRLYAERDYYGLAYQSRDVRYNPSPAEETFAIAYADTETSGISLADDDQKIVNQVEATRPGGATQRVSAGESIVAFGLYPQDLTLLKTSDNSVLDAAMWLVSRFGNPDLELRSVPIEAYTLPFYLDILSADISSYFTVYDLPAQAPRSEMRVTVEGYTETLKHKSHVIEFHTSNTSRDSVWILDDPDYSQLDQTTRLAY